MSMNAEFDFKGKGIVITGASEGIGFETAKAFSKAGANVAICGRSAEKLEKAAAELKEYGTVVFADCCDVSDSAQFRAFGDKAAAALGSVDVFINNAGFMPSAKLIDMSEELWDKVIDTNLKSVFTGTKIAYEKMKDHGGVIINAASYAAVIPSVGGSAYAAAKSGVVSLTRTYAAELAPYKIRVLGYIPGVIDTALNAANIAARADALLTPLALQKFGEPEDVAKVILFMASDAADYMTGTCLEISGGKYAVQNARAAW